MKRQLIAFFFLLPSLGVLGAASEESVNLGSGITLSSQRYANAQARAVVLWFSGQYGSIEAEHRAAARLAEAGMEVWLSDWLAAYFLPQDAASLAQVPDADLADWLEQMRLRHAGRPLVLVASGHASALPLRAVAAWRARHGRAPPVAGAVLLWPLLYQDPEPGEDPVYAPVVSQTRLNLKLMVPMSSAGYWWREAMQAAFEAAGSRVQVTVLPGLRDRFYHRSDANATEQEAAARLSEILAPQIESLLVETSP